MDEYELAVLRYYTANGSTQIAMIPQFAIRPGETWCIDFVGLDLRYRSILFIEVSSAQTPSKSLIDKLRRRDEWIPVARQQLASYSRVIDHTWRHLTIAFVIDSRVSWLRERLGNLPDSEVSVTPLSTCSPSWLSGKSQFDEPPRLKDEQ